MKKTAKILALVLGISTFLAGCEGDTTTTSSSTVSSSNTSSVTESKDDTKISTDEKIKISWYQANNTGGVLKSMGEQLNMQEYAKRNNVEIDWQHPADGSNANEQLNLIIASNQLPDVIFWGWRDMPGGIAKYIKEEVALPLNDYMQYAPDYQAAIDKYPDVAKVIPLDDGTIPAFYQLDPDPRRTTYSGIVMRTDWLETLKLEIPTTIDEWHTTLTAFKNNDPNGNGKNDELPWTEGKDSLLSSFAPAFGFTSSMYINAETNKISYGPYNNPAHKEFLTTMATWYKEGLIDPEFATNDGKMLTAKMVGNLGGSTFAYVGGGVGNYTKAARVENPTYTIKGIPAPKASNGVAYMVPNDTLMKVGQSAIITTKCKNPERVAMLLNYGYTEEGQTLLNYGIEGTSFEIKDGNKTFVDSIINPEEGKSRSQAVAPFASPIWGFAKTMDYDAQAQIQYEIPEQNESIENWLKNDTSLLVHPNMLLTAEEAAEYSTIFNEVKTYVDEMTLKFILGTESLDNYDKFNANLEKMNVARIIEIYQAAYERFLKR